MVGATGWPQTLDPAQVNDALSNDVSYMVYVGLVKLLPNGTVAPDLATWTVSKNHKVYTFTIRKNARFSNGDPVTAQDVKYSYTRALAKSTNSPISISYMGHILGATKLNNGKTNTLQGVKVLNSRQVQIFVDRPIAFFLSATTYPTNEIVDPRVVAGKKPQTYLTQTCSGNVGAGPFEFQCQNASTGLSSFFPSGSTPSITLVPNPYYYGRKPHIRVTMSLIANTQTSYRVFQANGIDVTSIPTPDIAANSNRPGFYKYPFSLTDYITPNEAAPPFNNVHCRLAVAYAIDRDSINNKVLHGAQQSYYDVVPKGMFGYYPGNDNPHYNPAQAKAELAQCPSGIHNVLIPYAKTSSDVDNEYAALQAMFQSAGIDIKAAPKTTNDWLTIVTQPMNKTHTLIVQNGNIEDYPDPQDYCTLLLRPGYPRDIGEFNDPTYNRLVDQGEVEFNRSKRLQLYIKAQHIALSTGAWISVGNANAYALVKPYVHGLVGSEAFYELIPKGNDWSNISISPH
jgi:ABC-type oligopeptide transport system substrate-binding subunit